jgi:hypothetical protein
MPAIIAGVGLYDLAGLDIEERLAGDTPFGTPSGAALRGRIGQHTVLFLARHGSGHRLLPHEVNQRADIFALKRAGATMVLGFSAVGSLTEPVASPTPAPRARGWAPAPRAGCCGKPVNQKSLNLTCASPLRSFNPLAARNASRKALKSLPPSS